MASMKINIQSNVISKELNLNSNMRGRGDRKEKCVLINK